MYLGTYSLKILFRVTLELTVYVREIYCPDIENSYKNDV